MLRLKSVCQTRPYEAIGALLGLLILANLPLSAATMWSDSEAEVDEHVADTQTLAPVDLMKPAFAQIPFVNFRYPHVTGDMDVTFIADDPVFPGKGEHHGIYRSIGKTGSSFHLSGRVIHYRVSERESTGFAVCRSTAPTLFSTPRIAPVTNKRMPLAYITIIMGR